MKKLFFYSFSLAVAIIFLFPIFLAADTKIVPLRNAVDPTGLVGYWPLDENAPNNFVKDYSGNGNHGTSTQNTNLVSTTTAKYGRALSFNGTSDYVNVGDSASLKPSAITLSAWVKTTATTGYCGEIINKVNINPSYPGYMMRINTAGVNCATSDGTLAFWVGDSANGWFSTNLGVGAISDGKWHLVTMTNNGTLSTIYFDGTSKATASRNISASAAVSLTIGRNTFGDSAQYFSGLIDDVRIYNRALSAAEVFQLYKTGSVKTVALKNAVSQSGLIGYWPLDDNAPNNFVKDYSGQGNHGTSIQNTNLVSTTTAKYGRAMSFNGTSDYVPLGAGLNNVDNFTLSTWIKYSSVGESRIFYSWNNSALTERIQMEVNNNVVSFGWQSNSLGSGWSNFLATGVTINTNMWYHVVFTNDSTSGKAIYIDGVQRNTNANTFSPAELSQDGLISEIGRITSYYFNGSIDDVRVYNRALSAAEIRTLYNQGSTKIKTGASNTGLVGYWPMNEGTGTVVHDMSGNRNTGTTTGGPTWVQGKFGRALNFDGVDDYVDLGDKAVWELTRYTMAFWFNPATASGAAAERVINQLGGDNAFIWGHADPGYRKVFSHQSGSDWPKAQIGSAMNIGTWYFVAGTYDGTALKAYLNGALEQSVPANNPTMSAGNLNIMGAIDVLAGSLDDVRIYNRALSAAEILNLYNLGKSRY